MRIECPRCRRVLEFSGERPSFCHYCGRPLADAADPPSRPPLSFEVDTDPERTGPILRGLMADTVDYRPGRGGPDAATPEDFPDRIGGYRLVRRLGSGGMGTVFEAEDAGQSQRVAIKLIGRDYATSQEAIERFRREGRLASAVTHPRCVFVLGVDEHLGRPYIVMELMPGSTLQTLVEKNGPLDPAAAIVKIFDVIEGLQEFHKRGLIHRDVKPSNCFLEKEGRVKIGDFGLSKSLGGEADLTRTGTFIGTPLYASPEQIKRDEVDERTDVYSVAATLYFLLSGRPPVQAKDAAEALARIASEPAPPLRGLRRDIPRALEGVIMRGLERDPARRWRNLREFHDALLPFVPDRLSIAGIGLRVGAYLIDLGVAYLVSWALLGLVVLYHQSRVMAAMDFYERHQVVLGWTERALWFLYFAVLEGFGGASLGKWVVGLRVSRVGQGGPAGPLRGMIRSALFYALTELPTDLWETYIPPGRGARRLVEIWLIGRLIRALGFLAVWSTMRQASGFRGPHEWLSGTRVVRVARLRRPHPTRRLRSLADSRLAVDSATPPPAELSAIGPYRINSTARWEPGRKILVGQDSTLDRPVWIVLEQGDVPLSTPARRAVNRQNRPRWIGVGEDDKGRWEIFTAPAGVPLSSLVEGEPLAWRDLLPILRQLAGELEAALQDGTLPDVLTPEQVWLDPEGGVQLVDVLGAATAATATGSSDPKRAEDRALRFLGEVARLALEGALAAGSSPAAAGPPRAPRRIRAAVPGRASVLLDRLTGVRPPLDSIQTASLELDLAASQPMEVSLARRGTHLGLQGLLLLPGLVLIFFLSSGFFPPGSFPYELPIVVSVPCLWVAWGMLTRGGWSLSTAGIQLVHRDGRRITRWASGLRSLLVWVVPALLLAASRTIQAEWPHEIALGLGLWFGALMFLVFEVTLGLLFPGQSLHDWIVGTELVPS